MNRWAKLWKAIVKWWRCEPPPPFDVSEFLPVASKTLEQYDDCYCRRLKISPDHSGEAASIVLREGHQRPATIESEVRLLAITVERILRHLQREEHQKSLARQLERNQFSIEQKLRSR